MNYDLDWLNSTGFFTIDLGLSRVESLLSALGEPQKNLKFVHVAGSNGKGSVCSLTESALRKAGFKTGFYCSPHLIELNERFRINGVPVEDPVFIRAAESVREKVEAVWERWTIKSPLLPAAERESALELQPHLPKKAQT